MCPSGEALRKQPSRVLEVLESVLITHVAHITPVFIAYKPWRDESSLSHRANGKGELGGMYTLRGWCAEK